MALLVTLFHPNFIVLLEFIVSYLTSVMESAHISVTSIRECYLVLSGGVLHDPEDITYQNHCNYCN
jgi:hypothetical protein